MSTNAMCLQWKCAMFVSTLTPLLRFQEGGAGPAWGKSPQDFLLCTLAVQGGLTLHLEGTLSPLPSKTKSAAPSPTSWMALAGLSLAPSGEHISPSNSIPTTTLLLLLHQELPVVPITVLHVLHVLLMQSSPQPYCKCHYCSHFIHMDTEALRAGSHSAGRWQGRTAPGTAHSALYHTSLPHQAS